MVNMEALDAVNLVGFVYHILLVVGKTQALVARQPPSSLSCFLLLYLFPGATIILPYYRNEHAVRARGVTFIIFLLWLTALRMPLPILDVLRTRKLRLPATCF